MITPNGQKSVIIQSEDNVYVIIQADDNTKYKRKYTTQPDDNIYVIIQVDDNINVMTSR